MTKMSIFKEALKAIVLSILILALLGHIIYSIVISVYAKTEYKLEENQTINVYIEDKVECYNFYMEYVEIYYTISRATSTITIRCINNHNEEVIYNYYNCKTYRITEVN